MTTPTIPYGTEPADCAHCGQPIWVLWRDGRVDTCGHLNPDDQWTNGLHTSYPKER